VPVGAVVVYQCKIIASAHNEVERRDRATAHAEWLALQRAFDVLGRKYLPDCTLYVTLAPCLMCVGACYWTKLGRIVYGATEGDNSYHQLDSRGLLHPKTQLQGGVLGAESAALLQRFFQAKRREKKEDA
jgi:tRNA(adenine34) deaminase